MRFSLAFNLCTDRCRLRAPKEADIPHIFSASRVPGFNDGMRWDPPAAMTELEAPLERARKWWADDQVYQFTVEARADNRFIGRIVIRRTTAPDIWNIGFWTHPREQGRGYMTEAAQRILAFGFAELGAERIEADHAIWNKASERVLHKIGMNFLEHVPQGFQKRGQWVAENRLGITREDWMPRRRRPDQNATNSVTPIPP